MSELSQDCKGLSQDCKGLSQNCKEQFQDCRGSISLSERKRFLEAALRYRDVSRQIIAKRIDGDLGVSIKQDRSVVTVIDQEIEKVLRSKVEAEFPDHGFIGEEFGEHLPSADFQWIVDPIDGTEELASGKPHFGTIIGLHFRGLGLVGVIDLPLLDRTVSGGFGLGVGDNGKAVQFDLSEDAGQRRRFTISSLGNFLRYGDDGCLFEEAVRLFPNVRIYNSCFAHVAAICGMSDLSFEHNVKIWDLGATQVLIEEAGGSYHVFSKDVRSDGVTTYSCMFGRKELVKELSHHLHERELK